MHHPSLRARMPKAALFLFLAALFTLAGSASAVRGRPVVSGGTLLSDVGTPLRGVRYSLDVSNTAPSASLIASLPGRGINTLHVYAENVDAGHPAGYNSQALQSLVDMTAANGLYLVITVGGTPNVDFAKAFWTYYAPLYKNSTHVIYEIQNEPWFTYSPSNGYVAQPYPANIRQLEADAYKIIRQVALAQQTPVLLFSYAFYRDSAGVIGDIQGVNSLLPTGGKIDWTRTAISFHGYAGASTTQTTLAAVRAQGYASIETELACFEGTCAGQARPDSLFFPLVDLYEGTRTSWLSFLDILVDLNVHWNQPINNALVVWASDVLGNWPGWSDPPMNSTIKLISPANGKYVRIDTATNELIASGVQATDGATFSVIPRGRYVALLVPSSGKYVQRLGTNRLAASATTPQDFEWVHRADGNTVLQAVSNWRFVSADFNLSLTAPPLVADRVRGGGDWERFTVQIQPAYEGFQEAADCFITTGWAWDGNLPNTPITVGVYDGATFLGSATANQFRQDLVNAGKGNGYHGFAFSLPSSVRNGSSHSISVKFGSTSTLLGFGPKTVTCAP